jgi:hypothetical protein
LEFAEIGLKPLGILFQAYFDRHLAQAQLTLQSEWIAQSQRIEELASAQKRLEEKAKELAGTRGELAKREAEFERYQSQRNAHFRQKIRDAKSAIRRSQSKNRFLSFRSNCEALGATLGYSASKAWRIFVWNLDTPRGVGLALIVALMIGPIGGTILGLRLMTSKRCAQSTLCQTIVNWVSADVTK